MITDVAKVPWHVGIYRVGTQICGGTIISERLVISAAHCFSEATNYQHDIDVKRFQVAAGKTKRLLDVVEEPAPQIRNVKIVRIPEM